MSNRQVRRRRIYALYGGRCYICWIKLTVEIMTLDHKIPRRDGGQSYDENLACCCETCNTNKGKIEDRMVGDEKIVEVYSYFRDVIARRTSVEFLTEGCYV